jgi:DNA-binding CsgD family transcriptional regulator
MKSNSPKIDDSDEYINELINKKIAEISVIEDDIPGVIIIWNADDFSLRYMSKRGRDFIGMTIDEIQKMGVNYHTSILNPEDSVEYTPKIFELLRRNNNEEIISLFQEVRPPQQINYSWFITGCKVLLKDNQGHPLLLIGMSIPIDSVLEMAQKAQRILDEKNYMHENIHLFDSLTKREKELLKFFALGNSNESISKELFISVETVATHRKNIKRKLGCKSNYDCTHFAQVFNLI